MCFSKKMWEKNLHVLDSKLIKDTKTWSNFHNTCFFNMVFCEAFNNSKAYFCAKPLSVNLFGVREWDDLYPFVEIVRIPELLDYYRSKGLGFFQYIYSKNYSLRNFFNYFFKIIIGGKKKVCPPPPGQVTKHKNACCLEVRPFMVNAKQSNRPQK